MSWSRSRRREPPPDELLELTRANVRLRVGQRLATVCGEGYTPGYGSPDFMAFRKQVEWDDGEPVGDDERDRILEALLASAEERGLRIEIV